MDNWTVSSQKIEHKFPSFPPSDDLTGKIAESIRKTQSYYMDQQYDDGFWWYELESNVTVTSEYLMLLHFLGIEDKERDKKIANYILKHQSADGTWSVYWGGEGDLSTTVEAYFALKLAGFSADDPSLRKARDFIVRKGGVEASRVFTRIYLALFGEYDWKVIPSMPVEFILLPTWVPFNLYNLSSWARLTIVPLLIVLDLKPVKPLPESKRIQELYKEKELSRKKTPFLSWKGFFLVLDRLMKFIENMPFRPFRAKGMEKAKNWILEHQERSGDWGGIQPPMVNSLFALSALEYDITYEPIKRGLEALERFTITTDDEFYLQACVSPIWDTALTSLALIHSGMDKKHPSLIKACKWLLSKQIFEKGDWSIKRSDLQPGGWAFEFENNWYPDIDDTAVVLILLYRYRDEAFIDANNLEAGLQWTLGMQGKDGGWGAFDVDNNLRMLNYIPFGDLEAMIDPSTSDLTGRVLELLGLIGHELSDETVQRAINFLKKEQEKDGSWWGRWGVNYIYGTFTVLMGLISIGEDMTRPYIKKAVKWVKTIQNEDGGWGECCESYKDSKLKCYGASTPSQTAWAILTLIAAGEGKCEEVVQGVEYLLEKQKPDGTWDEEAYTGTGFPKYFMLRYHNYRNCFPLMALGKFLSQFDHKRIHS